MPVKVFFFFVFVLFSQNSFSWGKTGHRIVAELSTHYLSSSAKNRVKEILEFESISEASIWPDRIKSDNKMRQEYSHLHYISFDKKSSLKDPALLKKEHIISGLEKFKKILTNPKTSKQAKKDALRFIIHLIGDLHQPLHVGYLKDKGGNSVDLEWFGQKTNLHRVWDEHLIDMEELSFTEYVTKLKNQNPGTLKSFMSGDFLSWAQESRAYLPQAYDFKQTKYWEYNYSYTHLKMLEQRLSQAGLRLAYTLNKIFK